MTFKGELRKFQADAVDRMVESHNFLLVHNMGLGKTVEAIAAIERLVDDLVAQSILVICPASVKWQWARQIKLFTDGALIRVVEGSKDRRLTQYHQIKRGEVEYAIMNYEQVVIDWQIVRHLHFDVIVADECGAIKGFASKRSRHIKRLDAPYKFGLTGQPIENRPEDLFSIMQFIDPDVLGPFNIFDNMFIVRDAYGRLSYCKHLDRLAELMAPVMDRKSREEVADQLPKIVEEVYVIDFDKKTQVLYNLIVRELLDGIRGSPKFSSFRIEEHYEGRGGDGAGFAEVMPKLMALRMLCDHPALLSLSAAAFDDPDSKVGSMYAAELCGRGLLLPSASPKAKVTLEVINEILEADPANKVVVFSFFKPMLRLLREKIKADSELFTGDQTPRQRDAAVEHFQNDAECRVLFSSDAGGIGVDIPAANYLISYDLPWSSGKFAQRKARIDRISSEWESITLLSMVMKDSIEEWMLEKVEAKAAMANAWIDGIGVNEQGMFEATLGGLAEWLETH